MILRVLSVCWARLLFLLAFMLFVLGQRVWGQQPQARPAVPLSGVHVAAAQTARPASDAEAWGDPVEGVQLHLALAKNSTPPIPGELPQLEIQIRNMGNGNVIFNFGTINLQSTIEIDGVWYGPIALRDPLSRETNFGNPLDDRPPLTPGQQSIIIPMGSIVSDNGLDLGLSQGKHTIRIETPVDIRDGVQTATGGRPVKLISNAVTIETTAPTASAQSVPAKPAAANPNAWGDAVDGVQLRLAVSKSSTPQLPGELPGLKMQIHNVASGYVTYIFDTVSHMSKIQIDGVWYGSIASGGNAVSNSMMPGARSTLIPLTFQTFLVELDANGQIGELDANGKEVLSRKLDLKPGKHSVRVRTSSGPSGVENSAHQVITLVSNAIIIDVPGPPTAQEQALADAISDMEAILRRLPTTLPELSITVLQPRAVITLFPPQSENTTHSAWANYRRKDDPAVPVTPAFPGASTAPPPFLLIQVTSFPSEEDAKKALAFVVFLTQASPTDKQVLQGATAYKWISYPLGDTSRPSASERASFQVGRFVGEIDAEKPEAEALLPRAFDYLVQELQGQYRACGSTYSL